MQSVKYEAMSYPGKQVMERSAEMTSWIRNGSNRLYSGFICKKKCRGKWSV